MKAPFPWFGGKSRVADVVWERFGEVPNYVEPFAGSLAVLLGRPHAPKTETVNDLDCYLANFWRAAAADPAAVAAYADHPVNEADLSARHQWLVNQAEFRERMKVDPDYFDAKIAGWWVWGLCAWIGAGWCRNAGQGVHRQLPHLGNAGRGVHRKLPHLSAGRGVHRKLPHLGNAGRGESLADYFEALANRLRNVRVACGDWSRVLGDSVTWRHGVTAVFLDPPYDKGTAVYSAGGRVASEVSAWCRENGDNPKMRIALCGYEGDHDLPGWDCHAWKAHGGFSSQRKGRLEIWCVSHCIAVIDVEDDTVSSAPECVAYLRTLPLAEALERLASRGLHTRPWQGILSGWGARVPCPGGRYP
jgi:hypothetical protein